MFLKDVEQLRLKVENGPDLYSTMTHNRPSFGDKMIRASQKIETQAVKRNLTSLRELASNIQLGAISALLENYHAMASELLEKCNNANQFSPK